MSGIKDALKKITQADYPMDRAVVLSVDKNELTCVVRIDSTGAELSDVLLKPVLNDGDLTKMGLILFPAVGSYVIIGQIDGDNTDQFIVSCSEIESVGLDLATALKLLISVDGTLNLNAVKMTFNQGKNGGIPLLNPLTKAIKKLQDQVNQLGTAFKTHIHPVAGASTGITVTTGPAPIAPTIKTADIENKQILQ